jgi:hypothetical protein
MINWSKLKRRIPSRVVIGNNSYEVLFIDEFTSPTTLGETRLEDKQIVLKNGQTPKELVKTYLHECLHAISEEFEVGLTEQQILKMEEAVSYVLKDGNVFKKGKK